MARVYRVREITRGGQPTGKFRMISHNEESEDGLVFAICEHDHDTWDEARLCPIVVEELTRRVAKVEKERFNLKTHLDIAFKEEDRLGAEVAKLKGELDEAQKLIAKLKSDVHIATSKLAGMTQRAHQAESADTLVKLEKERSSAFVQMSEANGACMKLGEEITKLGFDLRKVEHERDEFKAEVERLNDKIKNLGDYQEAYREAEREREMWKNKADSHRETLHGIIASEDHAQAVQWAKDGLSGYTDTFAGTLLKLQRELDEALVEVERLKAEVASGLPTLTSSAMGDEGKA